MHCNWTSYTGMHQIMRVEWPTQQLINVGEGGLRISISSQQRMTTNLQAHVTMLGYMTISLNQVSDYNIRTRRIFAGQSGASKFSVTRYSKIKVQSKLLPVQNV